MRIVLQEDELKQAMETFVNKLGMSTKGKSIEVSFTAGRAGNGHTATLDIQPAILENVLSAGASAIPASLALSVEEKEEEDVDVEPMDKTPVIFGED